MNIVATYGTISTKYRDSCKVYRDTNRVRRLLYNAITSANHAFCTAQCRLNFGVAHGAMTHVGRTAQKVNVSRMQNAIVGAQSIIFSPKITAFMSE